MGVNILSTWEATSKTERNGDKLRSKQEIILMYTLEKKKSHLLTEVELATFSHHPTR